MALDERVVGRHFEYVPQQDDLCAAGTSVNAAAAPSSDGTHLSCVLIDAVPNLRALVEGACITLPVFQGLVQHLRFSCLRVGVGQQITIF